MPDEEAAPGEALLRERLRTTLRQLLIRVDRRRGGGTGEAGAAVLTAAAEVVAFQGTDAEQLVALQHSTRMLRARQHRFRERSIVLTNDPYHGGTDLASYIGVLPIHARGGRVAFLAACLRSADSGGAHPGPADPAATQIFSEGQRVTPIEVSEDGNILGDVWRCLLANNRLPHRLDSDLGALCQGLHWGGAELAAVLGSRASAEPGAILDRMVERTGRKTARPAPATGRGSCTVNVGDIRFTVQVELGHGPRDTVRVAFAGTGAQLAAPFNSPLARTTATVLRTLAQYWGLRSNEEIVAALPLLEVSAPPGSIVHPRHPAACGCSQPFTSSAIESALRDALGFAVPERQKAPAGSFYVLLRKQLRPASPYRVESAFGNSRFCTYYLGGEWWEATSQAFGTCLEETECTFPLRWHRAEVCEGTPEMELVPTEPVEVSYVLSGGLGMQPGDAAGGSAVARLVPWKAGRPLAVRAGGRGKDRDGH